jgi:excisionase family DNA binding protein
MLTVPEAARRTKRDPETVRRWIRSGRLKATKIGTQHLIDEDELARLTETKVTLPLPAGWRRTATREKMPDVLAAIRSSRAGR